MIVLNDKYTICSRLNRRILENGNHKPIRGAYKIELRLLLSVVEKIKALCFELHTIFTELQLNFLILL